MSRERNLSDSIAECFLKWIPRPPPGLSETLLFCTYDKSNPIPLVLGETNLNGELKPIGKVSVLNLKNMWEGKYLFPNSVKVITMYFNKSVPMCIRHCFKGIN